MVAAGLGPGAAGLTAAISALVVGVSQGTGDQSRARGLQGFGVE